MPTAVFSEAYASLIARLVQLRKDNRVSQVELARRLGKTQQFVSKIEQGARRIDAVEFYAFVKAIGGDPASVYAEIVRGFEERVEI